MKFIGMDAYGVEMGEVDREWSKEHLGLTLYEKIEDVPIQKFGIITMSHVLEHFIDPIGVLTNLVENHLEDGGRMIIEVPNYMAPSAWSGFHAVIFNAQSLAHTLQEAGLRLELIRSRDTDPSYPHNLLWAVARKPHESDVDEYTEVGDAFRTAHSGAGPVLHSAPGEDRQDSKEVDVGDTPADGSCDTTPEDTEGS